MRTTVRLDDSLLADAKQFAAKRNRTLTSVIEEALRQILASQKPARHGRPVRLTTVAGRGLLPGLDLDDSAALLDGMDEPHASSRR